MGTERNHSLLSLISLALAGFLALGQPQAIAAGPVETSIFAVQGVEVDVTDSNAASAKNKALIEVQRKAFIKLAENLGNAELVAAVSNFEEKQYLPYLKSLSIEHESISPGRYQGKFTVRFLPDRIRSLYSQYGVRVAGSQGPAFLVLPIWRGDKGQVLWEDNPWRQAWVNLRAEQSLIPVIVPLGDFEDSEMISVSDVLSEDKVKLEAIRRRYDVKSVLVAFAEPAAEGGVRASLSADTPLGKITFDKIYGAEAPTVEEAAAQAAHRFHQVMVEKYKSGAAKVAAQQEQAKAAAEKNKRRAMNVSIPFAGPSEWNGLRSRILSTPGILGLDVSSLGGDGAAVNLIYTGTIEDMQSSLQASGLGLRRVAGVWVISPL